MNNKLIKTGSLIIAVTAITAFTGFCKTGANILEVSPPARPHSLGEAYAAFDSDASAIHYNPSLLGFIENTEIPFSKNYFFKDAEGFFGKAESLYYGFMYSLRDVSFSNIKKPGTLSFSYNQLQASAVPGRDGKSYEDDIAMTFGYSKEVLEFRGVGRAAIGANVKFFEEEIPGKDAAGYAFDFGAVWQFYQQDIKLGISYLNIGEDYERGDEEFTLPERFTFGASIGIIRDVLRTGADLTRKIGEDPAVNFGTELWLMRTIALRFGYNSSTGNEQGFTAGTGFSLKDANFKFFYVREITLDYAYIPEGIIDGTNRISMIIKLGAD